MIARAKNTQKNEEEGKGERERNEMKIQHNLLKSNYRRECVYQRVRAADEWIT